MSDTEQDRPEQDRPEPTIDPLPPEGPGGPDAVPDWEAAGPDAVVPDQPRSAQVDDDAVPDEIKQTDGTGDEQHHDTDDSAVADDDEEVEPAD